MITLETSLLIFLIASNIGKMVQSANMYYSALHNCDNSFIPSACFPEQPLTFGLTLSLLVCRGMHGLLALIQANVSMSGLTN